MSLAKKIKMREKRRKARVRGKLHTRTLMHVPRVAVFRSLKHIHAQIVDDVQRTTVVSCSSVQLPDVHGTKTDVARKVGQELAKRASEKGISQAVFDRSSYLYHGRIKALAEGLREGGLNI